MKLAALELFPCSGGMSEGFRRAGIEFQMAIDKDPDACESHEKNIGLRPIQMDAVDFLRLLKSGWRPTFVGNGLGFKREESQLDLIVADPPCTPWSRAGKRLGVEDERDMLNVTCEIIRLLRPRAYLIGNVPGLDDSTQWHHLQAALAPLQKAGYCIADYASLDAADFGVPQHRVRPFWFGHLKGPCLKWPAATHGATSSTMSLPGLELKPWVTCRQALGHLSGEKLGRRVRIKVREQDHAMSQPDKAARTVTRNTHGDGVVLVEHTEHPRHPVSDADEPSFTLCTNGVRVSGAASMLKIRPHHRTTTDRPARVITAARQDDSRILEWPWDAPSTTILRDERIPPPGHHPDTGSILSQSNAVVLSELAAAILQGFPESWVFHGATKKARWSQLGQAMPPPLAAAVAHAVAQHFEALARAA